MDILYTIIIGAVCGFIANALLKKNSYGLIVSIILGIAGSFVGAWVFSKLDVNVGSGIVGDIIEGASGAMVILFIIGLLKRK